MSFKSEISVLKEEVNKYLFCAYDDIIEKALKCMKKPFLEKQITYYDVILVLLKENEHIIKSKDLVILKREETIKDRENEINRLKMDIEKLEEKYKNSDIEFRSRHAKETNDFLKKVNFYLFIFF